MAVAKPSDSQSLCSDSQKGLRRRSPWLRSTLSVLDEKTKGMLELINEDADSFAKCAEMYYKKRPQLVSMVEDLYRAHRSLAERYDQLKLKIPTDKLCDTSTDSFEAYESEVDDPEQEAEANIKMRVMLDKDGRSDVRNLMSEEMEILKEENHALNDKLKAKDDEKREVIRQLSSSICILKEENTSLKKCTKSSRNRGSFDLKKLKNVIFSGNFFGRHS